MHRSSGNDYDGFARWTKRGDGVLWICVFGRPDASRRPCTFNRGKGNALDFYYNNSDHDGDENN